MTFRRPLLTPLRTGLVAGLLAVPLVLAGTGPADAAGETCRGRPATLVVGPRPGGQDVDATPGDDVVVVHAAADHAPVRVRTLEGDDTVCLVGLGQSLTLDAGPGDDVVDSTGAEPPAVGYTNLFVTTLGPGDDTFVGGPADDFVSTGSAEDASGDVIDLGGGDDELTRSSALPRTPVLGGPGRDELPLLGTSVAVDTVARTVTTDGSTGSFGPGFEVFTSYAVRALTFRGSDADEELVDDVDVEAQGDGDPFPRTLDADMGGGDDAIVVDDQVSGRWDLGPGYDHLTTVREGRVETPRGRPDLVVDLVRRRYHVHGRAQVPLSGVERLSLLSHRRVRVSAGPGSQVVEVRGCSARVDGGTGADRLDFERDRHCGGAPVIFRAAGGGGRDVIRGGPGSDVLHGDGGNDVLKGGSGSDLVVGDAGRDLAYGGPGRDRCSAEKRVSC